MVNKLLQGVTTGAAVLALGTSAVRAGELPVPPSPTNPNDNSATTLVVPVPTKAASLPSSFPSPTNPNPPPDQRSLVRTLFIAQAPNQVPQNEGQQRPSGEGDYRQPGARRIVQLEEQKREAINQFRQKLPDHNRSQNEALQQILNRTKK
jgi:hypothetical protein